MNRYTLKDDWYRRRAQLLTNEEIDYKIKANRLSSFTNHWPLNSPLSPEELSSAGFYYTGPDDRVQCAWCKGGLYNWEVGDNAVNEHQKHFPKCSFIEKKIHDMVKVDTEFEGIDEAAKLPNVVQIVGEMGYSADIIDEAVKKVEDKNAAFTSSELLDAIYEIEEQQEISQKVQSDWFKHAACNIVEEESQNPVTEDVRITTYQRQSAETKSDNNVVQSDKIKNSEKNSKQTEIVALKEENKKLKDSKTCKVCLDNEVDVLFLPCRHLACCEECADSVRHCPMCRSEIVATIKTFLS